MAKITGRKSLLFLNLKAFSYTGGLEKFNRCFLKALYELEANNKMASNCYSLHDTVTDTDYYPAAQYRGFDKRRISFVIKSVLKAVKEDVLIVGHMNLAIVGMLTKMLSPKTKLVVICHGIEVWDKLQGMQAKVLERADKILAVSNYTKQKLVEVQQVDAAKVDVFHNTIDPYFKVPAAFVKSAALLQQYGIKENDFVLFTLCRLSSAEQYKGYDEVMRALPSLLNKYSNIKYVIAGKYDEGEKQRVEALARELGIKDHVTLAGYIDDKEIIDHYQLGDVYIMPSRGEGFGIVFIEAMACGSRVIGGNRDGSVDALKNGELGKLVDPEDTAAIAGAIEGYITSSDSWNERSAAALQKETIDTFGFDVYKNKLSGLLSAVVNN